MGTIPCIDYHLIVSSHEFDSDHPRVTVPKQCNYDIVLVLSGRECQCFLQYQWMDNRSPLADAIRCPTSKMGTITEKM